jgi:hypothetical protein
MCLSCKAGSALLENVSLMTKTLKRRFGSGWDNNQKTSMLRVWTHWKEMGQVYQCWWRICREINVLSRFEYHMFYVLYPIVTYLLTLPWIRFYLLPKKLINSFSKRFLSPCVSVGKCWYIRSRLIPPKPLTIHHSFYHPTRRGLAAESVVK